MDMNSKEFHSFADIIDYYHPGTNTYKFVDENGLYCKVKFLFDLITNANIWAGIIIANNISVLNISATDIYANNIYATDIIANDIDANYVMAEKIIYSGNLFIHGSINTRDKLMYAPRSNW